MAHSALASATWIYDNRPELSQKRWRLKNIKYSLTIKSYRANPNSALWQRLDGWTKSVLSTGGLYQEIHPEPSSSKEPAALKVKEVLSREWPRGSLRLIMLSTPKMVQCDTIQQNRTGAV